MKKYKQKEWYIKKSEIINEIDSVDDNKFSFNDFKSKIKRNIPKNCSNKKEVFESLDDIKQGTTMYINGSKIMGNKSKKYKIVLIEILNLVELDKFIILKNIVKFIRRKIDWKWIIGTILAIITLLLTYISI